jgi:hypothetical protein
MARGVTSAKNESGVIELASSGVWKYVLQSGVHVVDDHLDNDSLLSQSEKRLTNGGRCGDLLSSSSGVCGCGSSALMCGTRRL